MIAQEHDRIMNNLRILEIFCSNALENFKGYMAKFTQIY